MELKVLQRHHPLAPDTIAWVSCIPVVGSWHCTAGSSCCIPSGPWGWGSPTWPRRPSPHTRSAGLRPQSACGCSSHCGSPGTSSGSIPTRRATPGTCPGPHPSTQSSSGTNSSPLSQTYPPSLFFFYCHTPVLKYIFSLSRYYYVSRRMLSNHKCCVQWVRDGERGGGLWRLCSGQSHLCACAGQGRAPLLAAASLKLRPRVSLGLSLRAGSDSTAPWETR